MNEHPQRSPIVDAAYAYINTHNWTLVAVGHNKKPMGEWGPGAPNRYDYTNLERVFGINAPGIGVITGPSGLVIIDLDNANAIKLWADTFGIPMTRMAKTPRGRHLYYQAPPGLHIPPGTEILPGVDVRGAESYAILPPSHLANGHYAWINADAPILPLPDEVTDLVTQNRPKRKAKILSGEPFDEGTRNDHLFAMACSMRRGGFDHASILAAISQTNKTRCTPPLSLDELESIAESAISYDHGPLDIDYLTHLRAQAATQEADDAPILYTSLKQYDIASLVNEPAPEVDWVWESYLAGGKLSILHGEGGLGKSYITLKIAEAILNDNIHEIAGHPVDHGSVIILDGENSKDETHRRIQNTRIRDHHQLHYYAAIDPLLGLQEHTIHLVEHLQRIHQPRLVIIDSLRALWGGDEREQAEAGRMLRDFSHQIANYPNTAYLLIHHDNKGGEYSGSTDINAAITGTRLHLARYTDKSETHEQPRILTQPKSRVGKEARPFAFELRITTIDANQRRDTSGIDLYPIILAATLRIHHQAHRAHANYAGQTVPARTVQDYLGYDRADDEWREVRLHMNAMRYTIDPPGKGGTYKGKNSIEFANQPITPVE